MPTDLDSAIKRLREALAEDTMAEAHVSCIRAGDLRLLLNHVQSEAYAAYRERGHILFHLRRLVREFDGTMTAIHIAAYIAREFPESRKP